jgi:hypothetical protein
MSFLFDICCGEDEEEFKYGGFVTVRDGKVSLTSSKRP